MNFAGATTYNKLLKLSFDPAKNERNIAERGFSFVGVADFDFAR
jgi:uncharacterized DUF497 family protein